MSENSESRNRWTAIGFGVLAFLMLTSFVYAFLQQAEAKKQLTMAIQCERNLIQVQQQLEFKNRQLETTIESLRLAVFDATQQKEQAQKKLK